MILHTVLLTYIVIYILRAPPRRPCVCLGMKNKAKLRQLHQKPIFIISVTRALQKSVAAVCFPNNPELSLGATYAKYIASFSFIGEVEFFVYSHVRDLINENNKHLGRGSV